jgi:4-hydroxy-3-polyprenylbenzoate decarboxylase
MADHIHKAGDIAAPISSGSFRAAGMIVAPCSMKTVSGIATSYSDNLLLRAADVILKERRPLVLLVRETPMHIGHLRLLVQLAEMGAVIMPPVPAFYHRPATLEDVVDQTVNRALDQLGIELDQDLFPRWDGPGGQPLQQVNSRHRQRAVDAPSLRTRKRSARRALPPGGWFTIMCLISS